MIIADWATWMTYCRTPTSDNAIAILTKRSYDILPDGGLRLAREPEPLRHEGEFDGDDHPVRSLRRDADIFPYKARTDLVVHGHAWPAGRGATRATVGLQVGEAVKIVEVIGDRQVEFDRCGALRFSTPQPFERIELGWRRCYGGLDLGVVRPEPRTVLELLEFLEHETHPGAYPRNPAGVGYVTTAAPEFLLGLALPNFEDPRALLRPETLILDHRHWSARPVPQGFGWTAPSWYPRVTFSGFLPEWPAYDDDPALAEIREGWLARGHARLTHARPLGQRFDLRFCTGASPGLRLAGLDGGETIVTQGLSERGRWIVRLPGERPRSAIWLAGERLPVRQHLDTIELDLDRDRATLVWSTIAEVDRTLPLVVPEIWTRTYDPFEGIVAHVEGQAIPHPPIEMRSSDARA